MVEGNEYGVVANVCETDRVLRTGARVIVIRWESAALNLKVRGLSGSGRKIEKYSAITRFTNFRPAWLQPKDRASTFTLGSRATMEDLAQLLGSRADEERAAHPNRRAALSPAQDPR